MTNLLFLEHELNGELFRVRPHTRLLLCGRTHGFLLAEAQSAIHLLECHREYLLVLVDVVSQ